MQYHKEYVNDILPFFTGKICSENGKMGIWKESSPPSFIEIVNNRALPHDIVHLDASNTVIGIASRSPAKIAGIIVLDSKMKYGRHGDKILHIFHPTDKTYPHFLVPFKKDTRQNKRYVMIEFRRWDTCDRHPHGTLLEILGDVGEIEAEIEHLRAFYSLRIPTWKTDVARLDKDNKTLLALQEMPAEYDVFSIDPENSTDIDDAFHFVAPPEEGAQCGWEIGIHIASPSKFFHSMEDMERILSRVSTVYTPFRKYDMYPPVYSNNFMSLLEGKKRYALSIIVKFGESPECECILMETIVKNVKNYTYNEYQKKIERGCKFTAFSNSFFKKRLDAHTLVESWMIFANTWIAQHLIKKGGPLLLRTHVAVTEEESNDLDPLLKEHLSHTRENAGKYEINTLVTHSKMGGGAYYTHFTSPIRRAVDSLIHGFLLSSAERITQAHIDHINTFTRNMRRFQRATSRLTFLFDLKKKMIEEDTVFVTYAYITEKNEHRMKLFLPLYKLEERIFLSSHRIQGDYNLYQKVNVKVYVFPTFENIFDKVKLEILADTDTDPVP